MGYLTLHKIRIINQYNTEQNLIKLLEKIAGISEYGFIIDGSSIVDTNYNCECGSKWYNCRDDMRIISEKLPELEIKVNGKGEEEGDIWEYIYKDGYEREGRYDYFSDIDEEPHFEEENENNQLTNNNNDESIEMVDNLNNLENEEEFHDIKIDNNL